jgi:hypothetical protein
MRAEGLPSGVAVASVIASGSGSFAAIASLNQASNCLIGSGSIRLFVRVRQSSSFAV